MCNIQTQEILSSLISTLWALTELRIDYNEEDATSKGLDSLLKSDCKNIRKFYLNPQTFYILNFLNYYRCKKKFKNYHKTE